MKRNDIKKLHQQPVVELSKQLLALQQEVALKRQEKRVGKLSNVRSISRLTDDIARIETIIRELGLQTVWKHYKAL